MSFRCMLMFMGLLEFALSAERQLGVEFTGLDALENEEIQRECGKDNPVPTDAKRKVLNGQNVTREEALRDTPWMVSINIEEDLSMGICSGVLISRWHVLTAVHCLGEIANGSICNYKTFNHQQRFKAANVTDFQVRVYTTHGYQGEDGRLYEVKRIIYPASYNGIRGPCVTYHDDVEDIALFELMIPVAYHTFVCMANVEMPFKPLTHFSKKLDEFCEVLEKRHPLRVINQTEPWILKKHDVKYVDCPLSQGGAKCEKFATSEVSQACGGDSGGPAVAKYYDRIFSAGVLIRAAPCETAVEREKNGTNYGDIMTSVPYYKDWICKWTGICVYGADPMKDRRPTVLWDYTGEKKVL